MKSEIPQWVIEYNNANHQSSAGKAIKILMGENERMAELLKEKDDKIQVLENALHRIASRGRGVLKKIAQEAIEKAKGKSQ